MANETGKIVLGVFIGIVVLWLAVSQGWIDMGTTTPAPQPSGGGQPVTGDVQCAQNPSYTYVGRDSLNGVSVGGTDQIRINGFAPVTSGSPIAGKSVEYWKQNTTGGLCDKISSVGACGIQVLQTPCYKNSSTYTMTMYDEPAHTSLTSTTSTGTGATNVSIAANGVANIKLTLQATAKQSLLPFGGCIAVEYPNSVTSVSMTGDLSSANSCQYPWTYSVASTSNTYKLFAIPNGFDKDGTGTIKTVDFQIQNGATDITAGNFVVTLQQAYYYIGNDGNFYLGIEKDRNADTTKTASGKYAAVALS